MSSSLPRHRAGIFAYLNYLTPKTRREVLECLVTGLKRLEYRGYDSAGVAVDTNDTKNILLIKSTGKVKVLEEAIAEQMKSEEIDTPLTCHVGISHTRWATHGSPSDTNSHPHRSDLENTFVVVHNGIVTNYKDVKTFLEKRGYVFESETDTEIIAKLIHHLYMQHPNYSFRELVEQVINQLVRKWTGHEQCQRTNHWFIHRKALSHSLSSPSISPANVSQHVAVHHFLSASRPRRDSPPITFPSCTEKVSEKLLIDFPVAQLHQYFDCLVVSLSRDIFTLSGSVFLSIFWALRLCECFWVKRMWAWINSIT